MRDRKGISTMGKKLCAGALFISMRRAKLWPLRKHSAFRSDQGPGCEGAGPFCGLFRCRRGTATL